MTWSNIVKRQFLGVKIFMAERLLRIVQFGIQHCNSGNKHVLEYIPCLVFA